MAGIYLCWGQKEGTFLSYSQQITSIEDFLWARPLFHPHNSPGRFSSKNQGTRLRYLILVMGWFLGKRSCFHYLNSLHFDHLPAWVFFTGWIFTFLFLLVSIKAVFLKTHFCLFWSSKLCPSFPKLCFPPGSVQLCGMHQPKLKSPA